MGPSSCFTSRSLATAKRFKIHSFSKQLAWTIGTTILGLSSRSIAGDFVFAFANDIDEGNLNGKENSLYECRFVVIICSSFLAIGMAVVGAFIFVFSVMEDTLMQKYKSEGDKVEGKLVRKRFVRLNASSEAEYRVIVDYKYIECGGYATIIRKEVSAYQSDFRQCPESILSDSMCSHPCKVRIHVELEAFEENFDLKRDENISLDNILEPTKLDITVLPSHPNSGLATSWIESMCNFGRRWPTALLILFLFGISFLSLFWGVSTLVPNVWMVRWHHWAALGFAEVCLWLTAIVVIFCFQRTALEELLNDEYLSGGVLVVKLDDETLATFTSDSLAS